MGLEQQPSSHFINGLKIVASAGLAFLATTASGRGPELQYIPGANFNHQPDIGTYDLRFGNRYLYLKNVDPAKVRDFYGKDVDTEVYVMGNPADHAAILKSITLAKNSSQP